MEYYLANEFVILDYSSKNLSSVPNEAKQWTRVIGMHDSDYVMDCYTPIPYIVNNINQFHILSDLHSG